MHGKRPPSKGHVLLLIYIYICIYIYIYSIQIYIRASPFVWNNKLINCWNWKHTFFKNFDKYTKIKLLHVLQVVEHIKKISFWKVEIHFTVVCKTCVFPKVECKCNSYIYTFIFDFSYAYPCFFLHIFPFFKAFVLARCPEN